MPGWLVNRCATANTLTIRKSRFVGEYHDKNWGILNLEFPPNNADNGIAELTDEWIKPPKNGDQVISLQTAASDGKRPVAIVRASADQDGL